MSETCRLVWNMFAPLGSNDPESEWQIRKRVEYGKLEELLEKEGYTIEKLVEDGNCLFRAAARQLLGDEKKHQQVRDETVEYIIGNKSFFADFEFDIDKNCVFRKNGKFQPMDLDDKDAANAGATNTPGDSMLMEVPSFRSTIKLSADISGARSLAQPRVGQLSKVEDMPQDEY